MVKRLQKKFVILTAVISLIVLLVIVTLINVVNYTSIMNNSDYLLELLAKGDLMSAEGSLPPERLPKEIEFTTRFFVVRSDFDYDIDFVDVRKISSVSTQQAVDYATAVNSEELTFGTIDNFRFMKTPTANGYTYIFLDIESDIIGFNRYLLYSALIMLGAIICVVILSCVFSRWAIAPIALGYEKQKRFITDVNHEFKTPLAIIRANCDVLEYKHGEDEWIDGVKVQIDKLNMLVENLISLSKLDEVQDVGIKSDFSLDEALAETLGEFSSALQQRNLVVQKNISKNVSINSTETTIRKLFSILIENAIKYSTESSVISVELLQKGNKKVFTINNECNGVAQGKHDNWFDRFYRMDESRSDDTSGFGIGLSIAKSICENSGAKIFAESKNDNEITITVIF